MNRIYTGPFNPPPADVLIGAVGWRHESQPDGPNRWKPSAWIVVYPDHILRVGLDGVATRDSVLWAPTVP